MYTYKNNIGVFQAYYKWYFLLKTCMSFDRAITNQIFDVSMYCRARFGQYMTIK